MGFGTCFWSSLRQKKLCVFLASLEADPDSYNVIGCLLEEKSTTSKRKKMRSCKKKSFKREKVRRLEYLMNISSSQVVVSHIFVDWSKFMFSMGFIVDPRVKVFSCSVFVRWCEPSRSWSFVFQKQSACFRKILRRLTEYAFLMNLDEPNLLALSRKCAASFPLPLESLSRSPNQLVPTGRQHHQSRRNRLQVPSEEDILLRHVTYSKE